MSGLIHHVILKIILVSEAAESKRKSSLRRESQGAQEISRMSRDNSSPPPALTRSKRRTLRSKLDLLKQSMYLHCKTPAPYDWERLLKGLESKLKKRVVINKQLSMVKFFVTNFNIEHTFHSTEFKMNHITFRGIKERNAYISVGSVLLSGDKLTSRLQFGYCYSRPCTHMYTFVLHEIFFHASRF